MKTRLRVARVRDPSRAERQGFPSGGWVTRARLGWRGTGPATSPVQLIVGQILIFLWAMLASVSFTHAENLSGKIPQDIFIDSLEMRNMDLADALKLLADKSQLNIIAGKEVSGKVTLYVKQAKVSDALRVILDTNNLAYLWEDGIVRVMPAAEFETRHGYKFGANIQTETVHLSFAKSADILPFLNQLKSKDGEVVADAKMNALLIKDSPERIAKMRQFIRDMDVRPETEIFNLNYALAKDVAEKIKERLTPQSGRLEFDERSNKLVVTDSPARLKDVARLIRSFDGREPQVRIEAKIVQVILSDQYKFGVDWEAIAETYHNLQFKSHFDILSGNDKRGTLKIGTLADDNYAALLEALDSAGTTNILSSPSISAVNQKEAKILVGSTEPYVTTTTTTPASGPTTIAETVNFIEVGVKLYVTPTIHDDGYITMKIKPEVSSVTRTVTTGNNNTIPVVETSQAETTVMAKDGVTIIIGGLIKEEIIDKKNSVPFLGRIPLVGAAFRNTDQFKRKTEIVIFLTPRLVSGDKSDDKKGSRVF